MLTAKCNNHPLRIIIRPEFERSLVEPDGLQVGTERCRPLRSFVKRGACGVRHIGEVEARSTSELERSQIMVREHLGPILGSVPRQRLDPLGGSSMLRDALGSRNLAISDVANQNVAELVFRLPCDGRAASAPDELSPDKRAELLVELLSRHGADRRERTDPKDLSEHCRILEQRLSLDVERVEARCDDALHGLRQRQLLCRPALSEHAHELLRVQRVTAGAVEQHRLRLGREERPLAQRRDQLRGLFVGQRRQRDDRQRDLEGGPARGEPPGERDRDSGKPGDRRDAPGDERHGRGDPTDERHRLGHDRRVGVEQALGDRRRAGDERRVVRRSPGGHVATGPQQQLQVEAGLRWRRRIQRRADPDEPDPADDAEDQERAASDRRSPAASRHRSSGARVPATRLDTW